MLHTTNQNCNNSISTIRKENNKSSGSEPSESDLNHRKLEVKIVKESNQQMERLFWNGIFKARIKQQ